MLEFRQAMSSGTGTAWYRLLISFETEEARQRWVASDEHQLGWPTIEGTLMGSKYRARLYDML